MSTDPQQALNDLLGEIDRVCASLQVLTTSSPVRPPPPQWMDRDLFLLRAAKTKFEQARAQIVEAMPPDDRQAQDKADDEAYHRWATAVALASLPDRADSFNVRPSDLARNCPIHGTKETR